MKQISVFLFAAATLTACASGPVTQAPAPVAVASRTFTASIDDVRRASMRALDRMDIVVVNDEATTAGWRIAAGDASTVAIELVPLSDNTTRMRVIADQRSVASRQATTASEILAQTGKTMRDVRKSRAGFIQSRWRWSELIGTRGTNL